MERRTLGRTINRCILSPVLQCSRVRSELTSIPPQEQTTVSSETSIQSCIVFPVPQALVLVEMLGQQSRNREGREGDLAIKIGAQKALTMLDKMRCDEIRRDVM